MKKAGNVKKLICLIAMTCLMISCGNETVAETAAVKTSKETLSMLEEADLSYEVPENLPGILVDIRGYGENEKKEAIFISANLPSSFFVRSKETGLTVYTGHIKVRESTEDADGKVTGVGDFTDLTNVGEYYIEAEILGQSHEFSIIEDRLNKLLKESLDYFKEFHCNHYGKTAFEDEPDKTLDVTGGWHTDKDGGKDVVTGCNAAIDLMTAYEYHPDPFYDDDGNKIPDVLDEVKYETDWLLKMQNPETGGVYTSVSSIENKSGGKELLLGGETTKATAYFCVAMTKFSSIYRSFDVPYATTCQRAAQKAWNCLELNKDIVSPEQRFRAAAEMYRVYGTESCHRVIKEYLKNNSKASLDARITLDGAIAYLSTKRNTDRTYCTNLMESFMDRTEEKVSAANKSRYMIEYTDMSNTEILRNTTELVVLDTVIPNVEYENLERNYLHYMCGRNKESKDLLFMDEENPDFYAELVVLISKLSENK
jgi:endoglucanase